MTNRKKLPLIISIITLLSFITSAKAEVKVVTSIKPIHSLVSYVMDGVGAPDLIVDGFNSPHNFQLKQFFFPNLLIFEPEKFLHSVFEQF